MPEKERVCRSSDSIIGKLITGIGDWAMGRIIRLHTDENQAVWAFYRKALQPQRVHQRKDRCVRADTERQRQHRDEYEAGRPTELAQSISCILAQVFEPGPLPFSAIWSRSTAGFPKNRMAACSAG